MGTLADRYRDATADEALAAAAEPAADAEPEAETDVAEAAPRRRFGLLRRNRAAREPADDPDVSPAEPDADDDPEPRRRRGVFGTVWAVIRFLLIGSKRRKKPGAGRPGKRTQKNRDAAPQAGSAAAEGARNGSGRRFAQGAARRLRLPGLFGRLGRTAGRLGVGRFVRLPGFVQRRLPARLAARLVPMQASAPQAAPELPPDPARDRHMAAATHILRPLDLSQRVGQMVELNLDKVRAAGMVTPFGERTQIAEEFRLIKRPLLLNAFEEGPKAIRNGNVIMVASSRSGEGKTFTAINLAMSIATERDLTVLLIDADVAKPDIANVLGFKADVGLVDLIADDGLDVSQVMLRTSIDNLSILPAGRPHHLATELLASDRMAKLVSELSLRYPERVIVMDSPPALQSSVAGVLALNVGQILFVVEAERTSQTAVDSALGLVSACQNINLLLNKSRPMGGNERFGAGYGGYY